MRALDISRATFSSGCGPGRECLGPYGIEFKIKPTAFQNALIRFMDIGVFSLYLPFLELKKAH